MKSEQFLAQVVENGRITIPKPVRDLLELKKGDTVRVSILEKVET